MGDQCHRVNCGLKPTSDTGAPGWTHGAGWGITFAGLLLAILKDYLHVLLFACYTFDRQVLKMEGPDAVNSLLPQLPPALQLHILSFLPPDEVALSGRLVSPDLRDALRDPQSCTAVFFQPLPPHAVPFAQEAGQQHVRQLPFRHKLQLLCTAAASGSEAKTDMVLTCLQPSIFPEMLQSWQAYDGPDPGVAAVKAGHRQLLGWLLHRCPALVDPGRVLAAAARHCDLAGLQATWEVLQVGLSGGSGCRSPVLSQRVLDAAARSATPDAVDKMQWILAESSDATCCLQGSTAAAAARSGGLARLRWLDLYGCPVARRGAGVLRAALKHADLAVAQWLVDEAGCKLPSSTASGRWGPLCAAAAKGKGFEAKLQWLEARRGAPLSASLLRVAAAAAIENGRLEVVQHLQSLPQMEGSVGRGVLQRALDTEVATCTLPMLQLLHQRAGVVLSHTAYMAAARAGSVAAVRWLACEASVATNGLLLGTFVASWPRDTPAHSRDLLQAVQLLVGEAGPHRDWHASIVLSKAAARGELPMVQFLLRQRPGLRPDWEDVADAVEGGCPGVLECLAARRGPGVDLPRRSHYLTAAKAGDRAMLEALRRLGEPWDVEVVQAAREGCEVAVLRWMVEQGAPMGSERVLHQEVGRKLRQLGASGLVGAAQGRALCGGVVARLRGVGGRSWHGWERSWACFWWGAVCLWVVVLVCGVGVLAGHLVRWAGWALGPMPRV